MLQIKHDLFPGRLIFIAGSTHQGEEALFLRAYLRLKQQFPALLLILVARYHGVQVTFLTYALLKN